MINDINRAIVEIEYAVKEFLSNINFQSEFKIEFLGNLKFNHTYKPETSFKVHFNKPLTLELGNKNYLKVRYCENINQINMIKLFYLSNKAHNINLARIIWTQNNILFTEWIDEYPQLDSQVTSYRIGHLHGNIEKNSYSFKDKNKKFLMKKVHNYFKSMEEANELFPFHPIITNQEKELILNRLDPILQKTDIEFVLTVNEWKKEDIIFDYNGNPLLIDNETISFNLTGFTIWHALKVRRYFPDKLDQESYIKGIKENFNDFENVILKNDELFRILFVLQHGAKLHNMVRTAKKIDSIKGWKFLYKEIFEEHLIWINMIIEGKDIVGLKS
ncbi:hypothetical protein [Bacillus pseudomycoides]|uniref:hypothetical protein n=1 Tax=Bacillus pseudomycoides TaxID=64104 RepID=UPI000BF9F5BD|nr:hypothetical protein [Bacillus pseudomycoides]PGD73707.1 hypothetical protein COM46_21755 [Bacillus pseudomycoides]